MSLQSEMWEGHPGAHTVRSHGITVAREHLHDWLILILLGVILVVLNLIHPFHRFVGKDMMYDLKYPFNSNTIPAWAVPVSQRYSTNTYISVELLLCYKFTFINIRRYIQLFFRLWCSCSSIFIEVMYMIFIMPY